MTKRIINSDSKLKFTYNRIFKFFASLRFAILILFVFAAAMIYGTVAESLHGTEYVKKAVYHNWWFYLIQLALLINILFAALDRIPFKKKLMGFYLIHLSLVVILSGAAVTWYFGIDGTMELNQDNFTSTVNLSDDALYLSGQDRYFFFKLPSAVKSVNFHADQKHLFSLPDGSLVTIAKYLPYAKNANQWVEQKGAWISSWEVINDSFQQTIDLSNVPQNDVPSRLSIGPIGFEVLAPEIFEELSKTITSKLARYLIIDSTSKQTFLAPDFKDSFKVRSRDRAIELSLSNNSKTGISYLQLKIAQKILKFIPKFSIFPVIGHLNVDTKSEYVLIDLENYRAGNSVLITRMPDGSKRIAMGKKLVWSIAEYSGAPVKMPWMNLSIRLADEKLDSVPRVIYESAEPDRDDKNNYKGVLLRVKRNNEIEELWVRTGKSVRSELTSFEAYLGSSQVELPFKLSLERFKMEQIPGTDSPASYESFVFINNQSESAHIFMNHPLKKDGYTFYQSSYFQDERGSYHSVLSVNKDPGRGMKYFGSLLLVIGLILHFLILYKYIKV